MLPGRRRILVLERLLSAESSLPLVPLPLPRPLRIQPPLVSIPSCKRYPSCSFSSVPSCHSLQFLFRDNAPADVSCPLRNFGFELLQQVLDEQIGRKNVDAEDIHPPGLGLFETEDVGPDDG
jgi:hypothetical protein